MEEEIVIDPFTKDLFGIKEHTIIVSLNIYNGAINKKIYNSFIDLLKSNDIGYQITRKRSNETYQFQLTNYTAGNLRNLLPTIVDDEDDKGIDDIEIHSTCTIIPCESNGTVDGWAYKLYWNEKTGFYKMHDNNWDVMTIGAFGYLF